MKKFNLLLSVYIFLLFISVPNIFAVPGDLDTTFGTGGKLVTTLTTTDSSKDVVIQPDGKILVVGENQQNVPDYDLALIRYNSDGSFDSSFGTAGVVRLSETGNQRPSGLLLQADGKIIVYGSETNTASNLLLYRFNTDGSLDSSFGSGGKTVISFTGSSAGNHAVLQPDGKIVIAGTLVVNGIAQMTIFRLNTNATLDTTFNSVGYNAIVTPSSSFGYVVALQNDGKIIFGGTDSSVCKWGFLNPDGTIDGTFVSTNFRDKFLDIAVQSDGKVVFTGLLLNTYTVTRYNSDKTIDTFFGNSGNVQLTFQTAALAIQPNGKIIVGGYGAKPNTTNFDFALARLDRNGLPDFSFGNIGIAYGDVSGGFDSLKNIAFSDGKVVAVGRPQVNGYALARFDASEVAVPYRPAFDFDGDGKADVGVFRSSNAFWYILNSSNGAFSASNFGLPTDKTVPADYDGDGKTDIAVLRNDRWFVMQSLNNTLWSTTHGLAGDISTVGDFDFDGRADATIFRNGLWSYRRTVNGETINQTFGTTGDKPIAKDYDGDGRIDLAIYRPSNGNWNIRNSSTAAVTSINFGLSDDLPVPADYDGDGKTDIAVFRPSVGDWYWLNSSDGSFSGVHWGANGDKPVAADYDGDGKADIAVFRPSDGTWYIYQSTAGFKAVNWGISTDIPIPNVYVR